MNLDDERASSRSSAEGGGRRRVAPKDEAQANGSRSGGSNGGRSNGGPIGGSNGRSNGGRSNGEPIGGASGAPASQPGSSTGIGSAGSGRLSGNGSRTGNGSTSGYGANSANGSTSGNGSNSANGSIAGAGDRSDPVGWRLVVPGETPKAPEMPAPFRRIQNGSPAYRGPRHPDEGYSPSLYRFSRMHANEFSPPTNIWLVVFGMVGVALALLFVISLPGLLNRGGAPVASPSQGPSASQFVIIVPTPTPRPPATSPGARASATATAGPSYRTTYKVQSGDTVTRIANKFGLKTWELLAANPTLAANPNSLHINMVLNIPYHGQLTPAP